MGLVEASAGIFGLVLFVLGTLYMMYYLRTNIPLSKHVGKKIMSINIIFIVAFLLIFLVLMKSEETFFTPNDSFTMGSFAFLIATFAYQNRSKDDSIKKVLLLVSLSVILFFVGGFIGIADKMFGTMFYSASVQNTTFIVASFGLLLSSGNFVAFLLKEFE